MLLEIIENKLDYCRYFDSHDLIKFWGYFLGLDTLSWKYEIRKLIQYGLVLPIGSSDAERGFSVMNHIKGSRSSRISPDHLETYMRIRLNGPDIKEFQAGIYAKIWCKHHMATDNRLGIKTTPSPTQEKEEDDDELGHPEIIMNSLRANCFN